MKPCWTVEFDAHGPDGIVRNRIGQFDTLGDAERWLEDNPDTPNPVIKKSWANQTCEWRRPQQRKGKR